MPDASESSRRSRLAQFGLPFEKQETTVGALSGGERARLLLNLVAMDAPHILILDEPTNHLDIDSRRALLDALNEYTGAVILITHDRSLMELVADRLWLAADGSVKPFDGDMEDYRRLILEGPEARAAGSRAADPGRAASAQDRRREQAQRRAELAPLRKRIKETESLIERLHKELHHLDTSLADGDLYANDPSKAARLARERAEAARRLATAEDDWLALSGEYEAAAAEA